MKYNMIDLVEINEAHITEDSFGAMLPDDWQEIADRMNDMINEKLARYNVNGEADPDGEYVDRDDLCNLWDMQ